MLGLMFGNNVSQKVIEINVENGTFLNLSDLFPNYNLDWAIINIIGCPTIGDCSIQNMNMGGHGEHILKFPINGDGYSIDEMPAYHSTSFSSSFFADTRNFRFEIHNIENGFIKLLVTAEFPQEEDTDQGDLNDDGSMDVLDVVVLIDMILNGDGDPSQLFDAINKL